ncbi:MAG: transposase, partial [Cyclobacteriaceae bacterium]
KQNKLYRLPGYDYSQAGECFITICTQDRQHYFGHITDGIMHLSAAGIIARDNLLMIPDQFENAVLDEWVIMPNYIHLILVINGSMINHGPTDIPNKSGIPNNPMELPQDTIGKMMRWYKGRVSFQCRQSGMAFAWQARFHDRIIRDRRALKNIRQYIRNNPQK